MPTEAPDTTMDPAKHPMTPSATEHPLAKLYVASITAAGAAVLALAVRNTLTADYDRALLAWAGLTLLVVFLGELSMRLPVRDCRLSFSDGLIFLTLLGFGTDLATLTAAADGYAASTRRRGTWHKRLFNTAAMAIAVNMAGRLFHMLFPGTSLPAGRLRIVDVIAPLLVIAAAQYVANTTLVSIAVALARGVPALEIWRRSFSWNGIALLTGAAAAGVVFLVVRTIGAGSFVAIAPVPIVLYHSYRFWQQRLIEKKLLARRG